MWAGPEPPAKHVKIVSYDSKPTADENLRPPARNVPNVSALHTCAGAEHIYIYMRVFSCESALPGAYKNTQKHIKTNETPTNLTSNSFKTPPPHIRSHNTRNMPPACIFCDRLPKRGRGDGRHQNEGFAITPEREGGWLPRPS